ncbi:MAG: DUF3494 domain-containing protein [Firmicutes bacterium]|nr:DUF3494 domain-containing protein [Bacillota bacterium]
MNTIKKLFTSKMMILAILVMMLFTFAACSPSEELQTGDVAATAVTVTGADFKTTITELDGTLQMNAVVLPADATFKTVTWSVVNGTGSATISNSGLLQALTSGTVTIKATSNSNDDIIGSIVITISNQEVANSNVGPVDLGQAGDFVILAQTGISTATSSVITGDLGVSPSPASYLTGFSLIMDSTGTFSTSSQVTGKLYSADYTSPTPSNLTTAIADMGTAYADAAGRAVDFNELHAGDLSGKTLVPGVYKYASSVLINTQLTLDGSSNDVWIFQIAGNLTMASDIQITLTGGAVAKNIFWQVADTVAIGSGSHFEGTVLAMTNISMGTNSSINGRLYAQTAVTLDATTVAKSND